MTSRRTSLYSHASCPESSSARCLELCMGDSRFDAFSRSLTTRLSRHGVRRLLGGLVLSSPLGVLRPEAMGAKKRKKKRKKKPSPGCTPQCAGKVCGDDGCGGICGVACSADRVCQDGACVCATTPCGGACCRPGQLCLSNGSCAYPCTSSSFPAEDCPCPEAICAPSVDGPKVCSLPTAAGSCDATCTTTTGCPTGRVCHSLGFGTCPVGLHCVVLC